MNSIIKRIGLASLVCFCAVSAFATQPGNNGNGNGGCGTNQQTNGCGNTGGAGGNGGNGGAGGNGTGVGVGLGVGIGYSQSESKSSANSNSVSGSYSSGGDAKATGGNANAAGGAANSSNSNSVSGYGGTSYGQGSGNSTEINVAAPVIPKPAANTAYVGDLPQLPQGSCRLFLGAGGTTRDGSATGMIPIGNDQTCLSTRALEVMKQINAVAGQTVFGKQDMLDTACLIEGMDKLAACKK